MACVEVRVAHDNRHYHRSGLSLVSGKFRRITILRMTTKTTAIKAS